MLTSRRRGRGSPSAAENEPRPPSDHPEDFFTRLYRRLMNPLLASAKWRLVFLASIAGLLLAEAVVDAGAVRFRPMLLTAMAVVVGAAVILADPIFQGLAIALMAGEIASLRISRMAVPVLYFMAKAPLRPKATPLADGAPIHS